MTDDRSAFTEARAIGKARHHEQRLDRATYTASEVRVLRDAALLQGRRDAALDAIKAVHRIAGWREITPVVQGQIEQALFAVGKGDPT